MELYKSVHKPCTDSLPESGWIKPCFKCHAPTSRTLLYYYRCKLFECYLCKHCVINKEAILNNKRLIQKIHSEINMHLL
mgnify:CR=1 FL=1|jgi:hypothetical protein